MYNIRKSNNPILRKLSDTQTDEQADGQMDRQMNGQMGRQADGQTDKSDFTGHCPTNVKHPKNKKMKKKTTIKKNEKSNLIYNMKYCFYKYNNIKNIKNLIIFLLNQNIHF